MLKRFLDISSALITVNYGRIYEQTKYDPSLVEALNQENYSKQAVSLASFVYNSILIELSQAERKPAIEGLIRRYNEAILDVDYFYKTGIEANEMKKRFDRKRLKRLRYDSGPLFRLIPDNAYYKRSIEQYQQRILQLHLAEDLFGDIRIEIANDPLFEAVTHAIEEFELYMWKRSMECVECQSIQVAYVEQGTDNCYCSSCASASSSSSSLSAAAGPGPHF